MLNKIMCSIWRHDFEEITDAFGPEDLFGPEDFRRMFQKEMTGHCIFPNYWRFFRCNRCGKMWRYHAGDNSLGRGKYPHEGSWEHIPDPRKGKKTKPMKTDIESLIYRQIFNDDRLRLGNVRINELKKAAWEKWDNGKGYKPPPIDPFNPPKKHDIVFLYGIPKSWWEVHMPKEYAALYAALEDHVLGVSPGSEE